MGRAPCCDKANVKKGPWSPEEDAKLKDYIDKHGTGGNWIALPQKVGLKRCGKSCRLRWLNYLRPDIKHGEFSDHEDRIICSLYASIGSRWSVIAAQLPGRTDNDIKNYWNTKLKKKLLGIGPNSQRKLHHHHHHQQQQQVFSFPSSSNSSPSQSSSFYTSCTTVSLEPFHTPSISQDISSIYMPSSVLIHGAAQQDDHLQLNMEEPNMIMFGGDHQDQQQISIVYGNNQSEEQQFVHGEVLGEKQIKVESNDDAFVAWNNGDQSSLEYNYEEIKQLLNCNNNNNTNNAVALYDEDDQFGIDIKEGSYSQGKVLMYQF